MEQEQKRNHTAKKTFREMSDSERARHSLSARIFRATLVGSIVFGVVGLVVGLGLYTRVLTERYISQAVDVTPSAYASVRHGVDSISIAKEVMEIYRGLSEEERMKTGTEEYRALFAHVVDIEGYDRLQNILLGFVNSSDVDDVYLAMFDRDTGALVYIADPDEDPETAFAPGEWESVAAEEAEKFLRMNSQDAVMYDVSNEPRYGWMCTAGVPLQDKETGETVAFVLADVTLESVALGMRNFVLQFTAAMVAATALLAYFMTRRMKRTVILPINAIAGAAERYARDKLDNADVSDHFKSLEIRTGDEIENLSLVMGDMESELADFEEKLTREVAEKERIGTELSMAANIQMELLPSTFPAFPDRSEFTIYATMDPAKEVGGDFYDFFMIDEDHICLVVADVSGKGVPAALFSMIAKTMLKMQAQTRRDPEYVLREVNAALSENNDEAMFVTVWLGVLEISTLELTYADAGHEKPLLYRNGAWSFLPKDDGVALAVFTPEEIERLDDPILFRNQTIRLHPGDVIFQYTDGVTEAMDPNRTLFGDGRLLAAMNGAPSTEPEKLLPHVRAQIDAFAQDAPQFDDITMLALRINDGTEKRPAPPEDRRKAQAETKRAEPEGTGVTIEEFVF